VPTLQSLTQDHPGQAQDSAAHESVKAPGGDTTTVDLVRRPAAECAVGHTIAGRYELRKLLGRGGFGTVYQGWDQVLEREVAVKLPHANSHDESPAETQLSEARLAAQLRHPGVVTVHDCGADAEGRTYVVFEFVPGKSLAQIAAGRAVPPVEAARLIAAIAEALHAAHRCGLVHRDLKPANILIDRDGRPRITDFGLAVDEHSQRQKRGEFAGTPAYMAPEQLRGEVHHFDGRTDIWALGVLFYELLTGRRPFLGATGVDLIDEILDRPARPPRQLDETIPRELEACCLRCLSKRVEDRYPAAIDVAEHLQGWLAQRTAADAPSRPTLEHRAEEGASSSVLPAQHVAPAPRPVRSSLWPAIGVALPLVLLALGGGLWWSVGRRPNDPTAPPAPPAPNTWHDLLAHRPRTLITAGEDPRLHWDEQQRTLAATAGYPTLIQLGQTDEPNYQVRLTIRQNPWNGRVGLFCGYGDALEVPQLTEYELVCLELKDPPRSSDLAMYRMLASQEKAGRQAPIMRRRLAEQDVKHPGVSSAILEIEVRNSRLARVSFGGRDLMQLVEDPKAQADEHSWTGPLGLYLEDSSVVVEKAEFRFTR
jgi:serine/threonine protein kinase